MNAPCVPKRTRPDTYYYPPPTFGCPRCGEWPFRAEDGCRECGLGRLVPVPPELDRLCPTAQGWAAGWPNTEPPSDDQVAAFVRLHRKRCDRCQRYQVNIWRRPLRAIRRWAIASNTPTPNEGGT